MTCDDVQRFETFTNVDFIVRIPVTFDPGAPVASLAGATVSVHAQASNGAVVEGSAQVLPDNTTIVVTFGRGTLPPGVCKCQVWAQVGQQAQMPFVFEAEVKKGLRPVNV